MSGQVRKNVVQNCFCELEELFTNRPNLSGQDDLEWESAKHERSLFFSIQTTPVITQFWSGIVYYLKTGPQSIGKFLTEQFWKVQTHPSEFDPN
jgi:hypothetical protein